MDLALRNTLMSDNPQLIDFIVSEVKSQGIFDQFRKECIADVDTKPAYQNLRTRVETSVDSFLLKQIWKPDLNKNQLRETLRKQMSDASFLDAGVERIVDQVVNPKIYSIFIPQIEDVVYKFLGLKKPNYDKHGPSKFKDLLPVDLDPVSPESDKNSLKDISLDSSDANVENLYTKKEKLVPPGVEENEDSVNHEIPFNPQNNYNGNVGEINNKSESDDENKLTSELKSKVISSFSTLNDSEKSNEKLEDDEDESPPFEPIESINFNESNVSNESHLSGISELTSHRSKSPNFSNTFSRYNVDFSNYDTEFSKLSSDSRLSIITDCGSSNQASTSMSNNSRDEDKKDKMNLIDNFTAIQDRISETINDNNVSDNKLKENIFELRDNTVSQDFKINSLYNESSGDNANHDKKIESDEKHKSCHSKSKSKVGKSAPRESSHKTNGKKSFHSESQSDNSSKLKTIEKTDSLMNKIKDSKGKRNKLQEGNKNESKNLKNIYKEKIRKLREKKEKITSDNTNKITSDSSRENEKNTIINKKKYWSSSTSLSSSHGCKNVKSSSKDNLRIQKFETQKKSKHSERRHSSKNHISWRSTEPLQRPDAKKILKNNQEDTGKGSNIKTSSKNGENRREKSDTESKDKKRKDDKKLKSKDNHCSLRNNSSSRHSSDRDGSNGSNGKNSEKSISCLNYSSSEKAFSNISNESCNTANSSNGISDNIESSQMGLLKALEEKYSLHHSPRNNVSSRLIDETPNGVSLPLKKRVLQVDENLSDMRAIIKKPKCENFQKAKKPLEVRKNIDKSKQGISSVENLPKRKDAFQSIFHKERQITHVQNDDEAKPYPDDSTNFISNGSSKIIIEENEIDSRETMNKEFNQKSKLSAIELSVRQSMHEMISGDGLQEIELIGADNSLKSELNQEEEETKLTDNCIKQIPKDISESNLSSLNDLEKSLLLNLEVSKRNLTENRQKLFETSSKLSKHALNPEIIFSTKKTQFSDDEEDCLYFIQDNEPLNKFTKFLKSLDHKEFDYLKNSEQILRNKIAENCFTMAPPQVKQKYSTSPLSDILLNDSNNNDPSDFKISGDEEVTSPTKKKRMGRPKKQRLSFTSHPSQHSIDAENFIMPLSPESDVSATSDKTLSTIITKEEKNRPRGSSQRYTSDDLYKPRPLFASSSRRSRRPNQG